MTLRLDAVIEHWENEDLLYVRTLPGFFVSGATAQELKRKSGPALQAHLDWLVLRDLIDEPSSEVELNVIEEARATPAGAGPRFDADLVAPNEEEIEAALAVGRAALSDLIDLFESLPEDSDRTRGLDTLGHVAALDLWYASRLTGIIDAGKIDDPVDRLVDAAGTFEDAVDEFVLLHFPELFDRDDEEWTLAKVLRRRTAHLREHLPHLQPMKQGDEV